MNSHTRQGASPAQGENGAPRDNIGNGAFRRRVVLIAGDYVVFAGVEDDAHHFELRLDHDGVRIIACQAQAVRHPWSVCPGAVARLGEVIGTPLSSRPRIEGFNPNQHCTHLYDLARFAIAQAARGGRRSYDVSLPDGPERQTCIELRRNGCPVLAWELNGEGKPIAERVLAADPVPDDVQEMRLVLRRALSVAQIRRPGFEINRWGGEAARRTADQHAMRGVCYAFQPPQIADGHSMTNFCDSSFSPDRLLESFHLDHPG